MRKHLLRDVRRLIAGEGGMTCREYQEWVAVREEEWALPVEVWADQGAEEGGAWVVPSPPGRWVSACVRPVDTVKPTNEASLAHRENALNVERR